MASGPDDVAHRLDREVVLPNVNTVRTRQSRDIGAVVYDELSRRRRGTRATAWSASARRSREDEDLSRSWMNRRAAAEETVEHGERLVPAIAAEGDVEDRVEPVHAYAGANQADSASLLAAGFFSTM